MFTRLNCVGVREACEETVEMMISRLLEEGQKGILIQEHDL
jgi:hypothetical protein